MSPTDTLSRRRLIVIAVSAALLVILTGVGVSGLLSGPRTQAPTDAPAPSSSASPGDPHQVPDTLPTIPTTRDPERFARNVAEALFAWDTGSGLMPLDYTSVVLAVGDPSGHEQAGLASDISGYLPSREAWIELRQYATLQYLDVTSLFVPDAWADAVTQARPGQLPDGATAITVEGIRHRSGLWQGQPVTSEHEVAFTVFLACPTGSSCHLLRLSQLDNPLR